MSRLRALLMIMATCAICVSQASAQGLTGKIGLAPILGVNMPIQYLQSDEGGGMATTGFAAGASGEYFVNDDVSVGARFMFDRFGMDLVNDDRDGSWTMMEFGAFARYQFMPGKPTRPFARAGLLMGKAKATLKNGSEFEASFPVSLGAELAGGVIHQLQPNLSLFGELGWTALATDGKDIEYSEDGDDLGTRESEKHLQWVGIKLGVIFFVGGPQN